VRDLLSAVNVIAHFQAVTVSKSDFDKLSIRLLSLESSGSVLLKEQKFLQSLQFRQIKTRHSNVPEAHATTFQWIFQRSRSNVSDPQAKFVQWLERPKAADEGIYWIAGKPGSGKSTLMKFICSNEHTNAALGRWAGSDPLISASYFFWDSGTTMQKSQEGLLQTLLYEILRKCPSLISTVQQNRSTHAPEDVWTRSELLEVFKLFRDGFATTKKFCFFIDGLDEYHGNHQELIEVVRILASSEHIKICASSRDWPVFKEAFDVNTGLRLYLQDFTRGDVEIYVCGKLGNNPAFTQATRADPRYRDLISDIVDRAQGVFLWVFLVVRSLLDGLTNADTLKTMHIRLRLLPTDLEKFYQHMLDSVELIYRSQMARTFQIALAARSALPLLLYSLGDELEEDSQFALSMDTLPSPHPPADLTRAQDVIHYREITMVKRIHARSKGLLEVTRDSTCNSGEYLSEKVDFLHRTAGDFFRQNATQHSLAQSAGPSFIPTVTISHSLLGILKLLPLDTADARTPHAYLVSDVTYDFLYYVSEPKVADKITQADIIDEFERVLVLKLPELGVSETLQAKKNPYCKTVQKTKNNAGRACLFELAIQHSLTSYVKRKLETDTKILSLPWHRPLLSHALVPSIKTTQNRAVDPTPMVSLLLAHGTDPNKSSTLKLTLEDRYSIWQDYLKYLCTSTLKGSSWEDRSLYHVEIIKILLAAGASPDVRIRRTWEESENWLKTLTLEQIFELVFEGGQARELSVIVQQKRSEKGFISNLRRWVVRV
jgi:hypothetical protein